MPIQMDSAFPPELTAAQHDYLLDNVKDWSISHGLAVRPASSYVDPDIDPDGALAVTAPVTLFPSPFPRNCFEQACDVQEAYNLLYAAVASNETWLGNLMERLIEVDGFIADLWRVHKSVEEDGYIQGLSLGLFRSDYMVHRPDPSRPATVKQVEFNTIASSFGGLSALVSAMHHELVCKSVYPADCVITSSALPPNKSTLLLSAGLAHGHRAYVSPAESSRPTCVLIVVQGGERNVFDQRQIEYTLDKEYSVPVFRLLITNIMTQVKLGFNRELLYSPPHKPQAVYEVSVVYYRAGYSPDDYSTQACWDGRLLIERSMAIKCPTVLTQLAGTKKVQQVLATPHSTDLEDLVTDRSTVDGLRATFAPIYPMDESPAGLEARTIATNPDTAQRYVLKPQREGGGNNVYRKDIPTFLSSIAKTQWPAYILMEMIEPPAMSNVVLRNGELHKGGVISELGIYGCCLWQSKIEAGEHIGVTKILQNFQAGYLLRTKGDQSQEGGVAAGYGAIDSVCLVDG